MSVQTFGFAFDIDGVVYRHTAGLGCQLIDGAKEAFDIVTKRKIPFTFLSNSTGQAEHERARLLSSLLGITINDDQAWPLFIALNAHVIQVILASTPFRGLVPKYGDRKVLVVALHEENSERLARLYGFQRFVTIQAYARQYPHLFPCKSYEQGVHTEDDEEPIEAVFIFEVPGDWGEALQILVDVLRSNGRVGREHEDPSQPVQIFSGNPDFQFGAVHSVPRLTNGAFLLCLRTVFAEATGRQLILQQFGKPHLPVYECAAARLAAQAGAAPQRIYMVGDNPFSDIKGAVGAGEPWYAILVRTGCFQGGDNDADHPAHHVSDNVLHAVQHALCREGQD